MREGITKVARKIIHQNAIKKTNKNTKKPINFIFTNFAVQINNKKYNYQNILS